MCQIPEILYQKKIHNLIYTEVKIYAAIFSTADFVFLLLKIDTIPFSILNSFLYFISKNHFQFISFLMNEISMFCIKFVKIVLKSKFNETNVNFELIKRISIL